MSETARDAANKFEIVRVLWFNGITMSVMKFPASKNSIINSGNLHFADSIPNAQLPRLSRQCSYGSECRVSAPGV